MSSSSNIKRPKNVKKRGRGLQWLEISFERERERERDFSLGFWAIQSLELVGTRRKAALRIETYAWAPILRSFDKLREVGDLSYLGFTLYLSVL